MDARGSRPAGWLKVLLDLTKVRITLAVTLSAAAGHFLFTSQLSWSALPPLLGIFLLACGSAALNQVQDTRIDARMKRTRARPIPSGRIRRDWALFAALALIGAGLYVLASIEKHTLTLIALGVLAVLWYNGVYLLLKRITAFAVIPGSLVGAIPPLIGWVSAGGVLTDGRILWLAFFFFLWQIPHFWLLLILFGPEYEEAGLPSLTRSFSPVQLSRITFIWILAVAVTGVMLASALRMRLPYSGGIAIASIWLAAHAFGLLRTREKRPAARTAFLRINIYALLVTLCVAGSALS
ncbi:MAG: protoheme IX farnesyltransferase [Planctomycetes bacterium]|nr:protoheme IX farnesyltransferase [Planctomycetota bacterium]